jgi:hypothetical protein
VPVDGHLGDFSAVLSGQVHGDLKHRFAVGLDGGHEIIRVTLDLGFGTHRALGDREKTDGGLGCDWPDLEQYRGERARHRRARRSFANREQGAGMLSADMIEPFGAERKAGYGATFVDHLDFDTGMSRERDRLAQLLSDEVIGHVWGHYEQN